MARHVHVTTSIGGDPLRDVVDAGDFGAPVVHDAEGLVQVSPDLFVSGANFVSAEYHDDHPAPVG